MVIADTLSIENHTDIPSSVKYCLTIDKVSRLPSVGFQSNKFVIIGFLN